MLLFQWHLSFSALALERFEIVPSSKPQSSQEEPVGCILLMAVKCFGNLDFGLYFIPQTPSKVIWAWPDSLQTESTTTLPTCNDEYNSKTVGQAGW